LQRASDRPAETTTHGRPPAPGRHPKRKGEPMCGIIGYCGHRPAVPIILEGLKRLEYRGYDSAGVAFLQGRDLILVKAEGKLTNLENKLAAQNVYLATSGVGHTRWATHGLPTEKNAHPHADAARSLALVHNGIIENYQELKKELVAAGVRFASDTDTEVLAQLIGFYLKSTGSLAEAIAKALSRVEGAYSIVVVSRDNPGMLYAARKSSPLVLGVGVGENFLASDIPAFLPYTREVVFLDDGEMARIDAGSWQVMDVATLAPVKRKCATSPGTCPPPRRAGSSISCSRRSWSSPGWWPTVWPDASTRKASPPCCRKSRPLPSRRACASWLAAPRFTPGCGGCISWKNGPASRPGWRSPRNSATASRCSVPATRCWPSASPARRPTPWPASGWPRSAAPTSSACATWWDRPWPGRPTWSSTPRPDRKFPSPPPRPCAASSPCSPCWPWPTAAKTAGCRPR